jgi:rare lipoprotein A
MATPALPSAAQAVAVVLALAAVLAPAAAPAFPSPVSGSFYHQKFEGRTMACGGRFDNEGLTAASNHHPCGSRVRVSYRDRSVVVRITDRCGRCGIDLTRAAARALGMLEVGRAPVKVERVDGGGVLPIAYAPAEDDEAAYVPPPGEAAIAALPAADGWAAALPAADGAAAALPVAEPPSDTAIPAAGETQAAADALPVAEATGPLPVADDPQP